MNHKIAECDQTRDLVNPNYSGNFGINSENSRFIPENSRLTAVKFCNIPENFVLTEKKNNEQLNLIESIKLNDPDHFCLICQKTFSTKSNLNKHINKYHINVYDSIKNATSFDQINNKIAELESEIHRLKTQKPTIIEQHNHSQNILQVVCVGNNDNYLDMLTNKWGDYHKALDFIKDCALSEIKGDCKLLQQVYFDPSSKNVPIHYIDKNRGKIEFVDENQRLIIDPKGQKLIKRLANNLQNTYLKGVNYLLTQNLENNGCPNKFLEEYDIQSWNQHIYELSDPLFYKKIINQLEIPYKY